MENLEKGGRRQHGINGKRVGVCWVVEGGKEQGDGKMDMKRLQNHSLKKNGGGVSR